MMVMALFNSMVAGTMIGFSPHGTLLRSLNMNIRNIRVPRRDDYEKRPVLSATIHPDIKRTLLGISKRTGMSVSQVSDEVLYTGLIQMQELPTL